MAGKHEQARGEDGRADGVDTRAGAFTDSEIPGEQHVESHEPAGEFVSSDIPGETRPQGAGGADEGEYVESDIPGEAEPTPDGEAGHYVDKDE
ncbi:MULTISPECIES: hypothetical protein [unclassified Curtobacterium]|jgi:hypothetical protein|uniref:hypothetical protein n=1 Tax=unclassified Curtobacterium TaxID=257496 RepID=UPI001AE84FC9|nr:MULTISPECIES: hypothetical protein [unclassified Curtobacterium]MBP1301770.1 hypothetical protein [Curtobacterium sp. 1310]MCM3503908.1 hypothetical protein [Curtobacterium sp. ODYSSEY 48 V2]MCM3521226.1 hypothetical protein [Curtobacterium sp. P97]MDB6426307.1 hypothetical protein [Curtobacterium sp. 20TX0008]MDP9736266.1 hypothetical protein [Curtobacterium sp. 260]